VSFGELSYSRRSTVGCRLAHEVRRTCALRRNDGMTASQERARSLRTRYNRRTSTNKQRNHKMYGVQDADHLQPAGDTRQVGVEQRKHSPLFQQAYILRPVAQTAIPGGCQSPSWWLWPMFADTVNSDLTPRLSESPLQLIDYHGISFSSVSVSPACHSSPTKDHHHVLSVSSDEM
jgi:hypothetical protein